MKISYPTTACNRLQGAAALEAGPASERRVVSTSQHWDKGVGAHWKQAGIIQNKLGVPQRVGSHITLGAPELGR